MMISRRKFLQASISTGLAVFPVTMALAKSDDGYFELTAKNTRITLPGDNSKPSDLWTYNGTSPGPEIRVKRGERVRIRLINQLQEPTSIHWHGIRIENAMDGVAGLTQDAVPPGGTFEYDFVVPDAGTYWFHAHNKSWHQVARGLYGALIVEEEEPAFDREHDLTLVIDDWRLNKDGVLDLESFGSLADWSHEGRLGNLLTVNGRRRPGFKLNAGEAYRLRLINASNARIYQLEPAAFGAKIMGFDGQSLAEPGDLGYSPMLLGTAQRVDLLLVPEIGRDFSIEEVSRDTPNPIADFKIAEQKSTVAVPALLTPNNLPEPNLDSASNFKLHMSGGAMGGGGDIIYKGKKIGSDEIRTTGQVWAFNGIANLGDDPFFRIKKGETVLLETFNDTAFLHAMHVHGHHFRIIERGGSTLDEGQPWRDTFLVGSTQTTKIAFVADNPGRWLLHCHMLEHAAAGMNTWFEVI